MIDNEKIEKAKAELAELGAWFEDFNQRQQLHGQYLIRAGYLQGFLAALEPEEIPDS